ncbi:NucA/NucB deoxyribonuclease domain-containing protein [Streptomyces sp. NPDC102437]|uniref:NucA/NucB deoxyribonuclease domain-containing protein n=1 Tax=Streptomyces sp. NPDC102437 TaxID=3366175 RepID=UPI00382D9642
MSITRQRIAAVIGAAGVTAALMTGTAPAHAQPTAQPLNADCHKAVQSAAARGEHTVTCTQATRTTAATSTAMSAAAGLTCRAGYLTYDRHKACSVSSLRFDIIEVPSGKLLGTMNIRVTQRTSLAARDSRTWKHTIGLYPTSASGAARGVIASLKLNCGKSAKTKCTVTSAPGAKGLSVKKETSFPFALKSPGSKTLKHKETPVVTLKAAVGSPATGSLAQAATVRCDSVKGITTKAGGCVHPAYVPAFAMSRTDKNVKEAAQHVWDAQRKLKGHPGLPGVGKPLHRTTDKERIKKNRGKACPSSLPRPTGKSCDEYPFASTKEGGATGVFSRRMINEKHNSTAGGSKYLLKAYKDNRVLNGDAFWVAIS